VLTLNKPDDNDSWWKTIAASVGIEIVFLVVAGALISLYSIFF
jgi:hypothetical protein